MISTLVFEYILFLVSTSLTGPTYEYHTLPFHIIGNPKTVFTNREAIRVRR